MNKERGFTLIELLVVVLIIGILAGVALPQYERAVEKARAVEAVTVLRALQQALDVYVMANGGTITSLDELDVDIPKDSYYEYSRGGCGLYGRHPKTKLYFEFCQFDSFKGAQFCVAPQADEKLNSLCKSFGVTKVNHVNAGNNYYRMN